MQEIVFISDIDSELGKSCATFLSKKGLKVYGGSQFNGLSPEGYTKIFMDIEKDHSVKSAVYKVIGEEGLIDYLINIPLSGTLDALEELSMDQMKKIFEINFFGIARLTKYFIPFMRENEKGTILTISAAGGNISPPFQGMFYASTYALEGFMEALRMELNPFNVKVALIGAKHIHSISCLEIAPSKISNENYTKQVEKTLEIFEKDKKRNIPPLKIAKLILKIMKKENPALKYYIDHVPGSLIELKNKIHLKWYEQMLLSHFQVKSY